MDDRASADEASLDTELTDRRMTPEASDIVDSYTGFDGWLLRHPLVTFSAGAIGFLAWAVILLRTNPAGISTTDDEYGPSAPLQPWVLVTAVLAFAGSAACAAMVMVAIRQRVVQRRRTA